MNLNEKATSLIGTKQMKSGSVASIGEKGLRIIATTNAIDRDGEVVDPAGADLSTYEVNPVVLPHHRWDVNSVGKATGIHRFDDRIELDIEWAPTPAGQELRALYSGGYMTSFSIGFIPRQYKIIQDVLHWTDWEMVEVSAVNIPANQFARVIEDAEKNGLALPAIKSLSRKDTTAAGVAEEPSDAGEPVQRESSEKGESQSHEEVDMEINVDEVAGKAAESVLAALDKREADKAKAKEAEENAGMRARAEKAESKLEELQRQMKTGEFAEGAEVKVTEAGEYKGFSLKRAKQGFVDRLGKKGLIHAIAATKDDERLEVALKGMVDLIGRAQKTPLAQVKDLLGGTSTAGAELVPDELVETILTYGRYTGIGLRRCQIIPMTTDVMTVPAENAKFALAIADEAAEAAETSPTFTSVTLTAKEITGYAEVSWALEQDARVPGGIVGVLLDQLTEELALTVDQYVFDGSGSPMSGIFDLTTSYSVVLAGSHFSEITLAKLRETVSKVKPQDRAGAVWSTSTTALWTYIYNIQQNSRDVFIPANDPQAGPAGSLLGFPVEETEAAPSAIASGAPMVVFGNLASVIIGNRLNTLSLFRNPYSKATSRLTQYLAFFRMAFSDALPLKRCRIITG